MNKPLYRCPQPNCAWAEVSGEFGKLPVAELVRVCAGASCRHGLAVVSLLNPTGNVLYSSLHSGQ